MGRVLAVEHRVMKRPFAVKLLRNEYSGIAEFVDRFVLEAQMLAQLDHPNLVRVVDVAQTPAGASFYVMELLVGRTLTAEVKAEGPLSVGVTLGHARKLASALSAAHRAGVVHRDLKPDNVFLVAKPKSPAEGLKLLDFGVAKVVSTAGGLRAPLVPTMQSMVGSPRFMAPELILGEPADPRSDVYALGLLLHFMLSGELPFASERGIGEIARAQVERELEPLDASVVSAELVNVVARATKKKPEERFGSMAELERVLFQVEQWAATRGDLLDARLTPAALDLRAPVPLDAPAERSALPGRSRAPFDMRVFASAFVVGLVVAALLVLWTLERGGS